MSTASSVATPFAYLQPTIALADTARIVQAIHDDGFALIPGVLAPAEVAATRAALDRLRHFGFDGIGFNGTGLNDHFKCVFNRERLWLDYVDRPGVVDIAYGLWQDWCHIIGMSAWRCRPGYDGRGVHVDQLFAQFPESAWGQPGFRLDPLICTAHYYLDDLDRELCPTWVIPGSHKAGRAPRKDEESWNGRGLEPVLCRAGDVLFFRSELWHSGSRNTTTDRTRYLLQVHYAQRNIAQKFSPWPWQFNPEILAVATPRQLRLLGRHPEGNYG